MSSQMPTQALDSVLLQSFLLNAAQVAIIGTDLNGVVTYWNPFAEKLYGWSSEEVIGRNIMEITVTSETEEEAKGHMASVMAGNSWAGEFQVGCKRGGVSECVRNALAGAG